MNISNPIKSSLLIRNALYSVSANIILTGIGFFIIPFMISYLGVESYGIWILIGSIFRYRDIFSLGLNSAVNRFIPHHFAMNEFDKVEKVVNTSIAFYVFTSILFIIATMIIYYFLTDWFIIPTQLHSTSKILVLIMGFGFAIIIPMNIFSAILSSYQRYDIINICLIIQIVIRSTLLILFLIKGFGLIAIGIIFTSSEISLKIIYLYFGKEYLFKHMRLSITKVDFKILKELAGYGINTFLFIISSVVIYRGSDVIIGIFRNVSDVTKYSIVTVLILALHQLLHAFLRIIKPAISYLNAYKNKSQINEIALLSQKYSLFFLIPSSLFLIIFGENFLNLWVGQRFSDISILLTILTVGNLFFLSQYSNFYVLVGMGEHRIYGLLSIITATFTTVFSVISLGFLKLDLISVAISTSLPLILVYGIISQLYFNKKMKINSTDLLNLVALPAFLGCLPTIILLIGWKIYLPLNSWTNVVLIVFMSVIASMIGVWYFGIKKIERERLINFLRIKL